MIIDLKTIDVTLNEIFNECNNVEIISYRSKCIGQIKNVVIFLTCEISNLSDLQKVEFSLDFGLNHLYLLHSYYINLNSSNKKEIINYLISLYE